MLQFLREAVVEVGQDTRLDESPKRGRLLDFLAIVPTFAAIVGGSFIMVNRAVRIADHFERGRGTAVMSEALNSNSFNVVLGLTVPALLLGVTRPSTIGLVAVFWLPLATLLAILGRPRRRIDRQGWSGPRRFLWSLRNDLVLLLGR